MKTLGRIIRSAVVVIVGFSVGHGVLLALNANGYFPERWVSRMIGGVIQSPDLQWILAGLCGLALLVVWEAFHLREKLFRLFKRGNEHATDSELRTSPLEIIAGTTIDFWDVIKSPPRISSIIKLFKIRVENRDPSKTISRVKVSITAVSTMPTGYRFPWVLAENLQIAAGDHAMVPLLVYEEWREPEKQPNPAADTMTIQVLNSDRIRMLGIEAEHTLQLRCTGTDVSYRDVAVKISLVSGRLRIEKS